jgi:exonuclease SbcC
VAQVAEIEDIRKRLDKGDAIAEEVGELETRREEAAQALKSAKDALAKVETMLKKAMKGFDRESMASARREHDAASRVLAERRTELREVEKRIQMASRTVADRAERMGELKVHLELARAHADLHRWLTQCFRPSLEDIELRVLSMMQEEMDAAAKGWFERLVEDPDLEMEVDDEFVPTVTQQGFDVTVDALSGGERTAVAFAYRLALNDLVQRIATPGRSNLLMLDEPTDGFSREQLIRMGGVLQEVGAHQVIIVSHDSELEAFADAVYVVRKAGGESQVTLAQ